MNHQFHYDTEKQAQQWLALHEAYSPARTDDDCLRTYGRAFSEGGKFVETKVGIVSLGCGGGQKDLALLEVLQGKAAHYVPSDVSLPLVLTAHLRASMFDSHPLVLDLANASDFSRMLPVSDKRIFAFFGMLPNFEPAEALVPLSATLRQQDLLFVSANLAPGNDYRRGVEKVVPLYDNELTRRWLATTLLNAGLDVEWNDLEFAIVESAGLLRIEANYRFRKPQMVRLDGEEIDYKEGEIFRLFFSYRHTPELLRGLLGRYEIEVVREWVTESEEEGVFLCRKITS